MNPCTNTLVQLLLPSSHLLLHHSSRSPACAQLACLESRDESSPMSKAPHTHRMHLRQALGTSCVSSPVQPSLCPRACVGRGWGWRARSRSALGCALGCAPGASVAELARSLPERARLRALAGGRAEAQPHFFQLVPFQEPQASSSSDQRWWPDHQAEPPQALEAASPLGAWPLLRSGADPLPRSGAEALPRSGAGSLPRPGAGALPSPGAAPLPTSGAAALPPPPPASLPSSADPTSRRSPKRASISFSTARLKKCSRRVGRSPQAPPAPARTPRGPPQRTRCGARVRWPPGFVMFTVTFTGWGWGAGGGPYAHQGAPEAQGPKAQGFGSCGAEGGATATWACGVSADWATNAPAAGVSTAGAIAADGGSGAGAPAADGGAGSSAGVEGSGASAAGSESGARAAEALAAAAASRQTAAALKDSARRGPG